MRITTHLPRSIFCFAFCTTVSIRSFETMASERLSAAADELIRAASLESNAVGTKKTIEAIQNLRNDVQQSVAAFKESTDSKINTTNQNINCLNVNVEKLETKMSGLDAKLTKISDTAIESNKMRSLEWAIANIDVVYHQNHGLKYKLGSTHQQYRCNTLIRDVLFAFRRNRGLYIQNYFHHSYAYDHNSNNNEKVKEEKKKKFRDEFAVLIHELTGSKPRIEARMEDGQQKYLIFYS